MNYVLLAKLFLFSLFIPGEFALYLGGLRLEVYRVILGIALVSITFNWSRLFRKLTPADKCILLAAGAGVISIFANHGLMGGIEKSGIFLFEIVGAYFLARAATRNDKYFITLYKSLAIAIAIFLIPSAIEAATGFKVVHELATSLSGVQYLSHDLYTEKYMRAGFTRATSAFSHPILNGIISAISIPISAYILLFVNRPTGIAFLVSGLISVISSFSSAPILIIFVQVSVVIYIKLKSHFRAQMNKVVIVFCVALAAIHFLSNRGIVKIIIQKATFNPHTGTHRLLIYEHIQDDIMRAPFLGSGVGAYWSNLGWMGQSIDNFWLAISFFYGIPFALLVFLSTIFSISKIDINARPNKIDYLAYTAKATIISLVILGITVHLFGKANPLFYFCIGSAGYMYFRKPTRTNKVRK